MQKLKLTLENGDEFIGDSIGFIPPENILAELVFNTSMTGYQEIISDPSYCDQIIVMTYPLIGNYGITHEDYENLTPYCSGIIVKEASQAPSNFRSQKSLSEFLCDHKIPGISGIDTRKLTKIIRSSGAMKAVISHTDTNPKLIEQSLKLTLKSDQIQRVSSKTAAHFPSSKGPRVIVVDFGYKKSILTSLLDRGCDVIIVPYDTSFEKIKSFNPDGVLLSNGPGDPKDIPNVIEVVRQIQQSYPMFAICMGHQIFALANGADTEKMKFGHRGANHPVIDFEKDRTFITSQNHGYAVTDESIGSTELAVTQRNLNDKSIEGLKHKRLNAFSVQYHPEANPGPNDTKYLFEEFIQNIVKDKNAKR